MILFGLRMAKYSMSQWVIQSVTTGSIIGWFYHKSQYMMQQYRKRSSTEYVANINDGQSPNKKIRRSESSILDHELLRIKVCERQDKIKNIFTKNQKQLCNFFIKDYRPMQQSKINLVKVLNERTEEIRLIKNTNKIYFGSLNRSQKRNGDGVLIDEKGKIYEGKFVDNAKHGHGIEIYPNGNIYIGNFDNNKKHGQGMFYWFTLSPPHKEKAKYVEFYSGKWWGGLPDGNGSHQKNTGDIYDGNFKNGLKHGQGEQYFYNGDSYKGEYVNGLPQGFGLYIWKDNSRYEGDFKQGLRNGHGIWNSKDNRQQYKGHYILDKKCGYGEYIWKNKNYVYKGHFENDLRHGYGELYHKNEVQYKGEWIYGKTEQQIDNITLKEKVKTQESSFKTPKKQNLPSLSRLRPPASAIMRRINYNQQFKSNKSLSKNKSPKMSLQKSKSPQSINKSERFHPISKSFVLNRSRKLKNPLQRNKVEFQNKSVERNQKTIKKRPASYNNRQPSLIPKPHYELLVKNCTKKNCGCNISIPLHAGSSNKKGKKKQFTHFKTQNFCF